jgi:hypothetical protein
MTRLRKIETVTKDTNVALKAGIAGRIEAGKLINEAREIYKNDDTKFGEWRKTKLSYPIDQRTANRYMQLAKCFSENLPEHIPLSGLYKLSAPENEHYRSGALEILGEDKVSLKDVEAAIEQAKVNQETITDLDDVLSKVNNFSVKDSRKVFMKIVEHNSVAKVQGWLDMASKPQEKAA